jgi:glutamate dehydrogenase
MTPEVERLVLRNNYLQTQAITITSFNQKIKIDDQESLMKKLAVFANLDRENEFLPSTEEMNSRKNRQDYLTRPELCVLFAYSKIYLYQELLKSSLINEKYFEQDLINYFPKQMQERFREDIVNHKLAKEIIATSVNNSIINRVGITFMNNILESRQCKPCDVIRAYTVIREIFSLRKIWTQIENLDFKIPFNIQVELCATINGFIHKCIHMLLSHHFAPLPITQMIENMLPCINILNDFTVNQTEKTEINSRKESFEKKGIPSDVAFEIAKTIEQMQMFQMVVHNHKPELLEKQIVGYHSLRKHVAVDQLSKWITSIPVESVIHKNAIRELELKLYSKYCILSQRFSHHYNNDKEKWIDEKQKQLSLFTKLFEDISKSEKQDFALVSMIVDKIDIL